MELNKAFVEAVEELIQETKCPICLDFFTNPRSAPCQHNFCEECIWEVIKDNHSECPSCRYPGCNRRSLAKNNTLCNVTIIVRKLASSLGLAEAATEDSKFDKVWPPKPSPKKRSQKRGRKIKQEEASAVPAGDEAIPEIDELKAFQAPPCEGHPPTVKQDEQQDAGQLVKSEGISASPSAALPLSTHHDCASNQSEEDRARKRSKLNASEPSPSSAEQNDPSAFDLSSVNAKTMRAVLDSRMDGAERVKIKEEDTSTTSPGSKEPAEPWDVDLPESARKKTRENLELQGGLSGTKSAERKEAAHSEQARSSAQPSPRAELVCLQTPQGRQGRGGEEDRGAGEASAKATVRR
eukprot:2554683-Rhodomonas_salina.1